MQNVCYLEAKEPHILANKSKQSRAKCSTARESSLAQFPEVRSSFQANAIQLRIETNIPFYGLAHEVMPQTEPPTPVRWSAKMSHTHTLGTVGLIILIWRFKIPAPRSNERERVRRPRRCSAQ